MAVSDGQLRYLEHASILLKSGDYRETLELIEHVISDSDIESGREELDEQWEDLWEKVKKYAPRYMATANITKINLAMAAIKPVDEHLWKVRLAEDHPFTILLGAGASKPAPSNIPVTAEFLPELWRRARKLDRDDFDLTPLIVPSLS